MGISRWRRYDSGCWTPEFRLWLNSILAGADKRIQSRLEERACEAGDRETLLFSVASAVNILQLAITDAREQLEREDPATRAITRSVRAR